MFSPFEQCNIEQFVRKARIICRQDPQFTRSALHGSASTATCPERYLDISARDCRVGLSLDTPSDREPAYQFFGRKRLLARMSMSSDFPLACPGDTIQMLEPAKIPKRFLLANYDPVPLDPRCFEGPGELAQFIAYEMDQDVTWIRRGLLPDPVTGLMTQDCEGDITQVIPVTLETLYEERDRSLVTKEDRRRVITGAPVAANDTIVLDCSTDSGQDQIEMKLIRVEYVSGIYVCEAL